MNVPFQVGQIWWNRSGGGAFIDRVEGTTIWYTKVKHNGGHTKSGFLLARSVFLRKYPLQAKPYLSPRTMRPAHDQAAWFTLRLGRDHIEYIEEMFGQLRGDTGLIEEAREVAEQIVFACGDARGGVFTHQQPDSHGSRITRVRPARPGKR